MKTISPKKLKSHLEKNKVVLVDVREEHEHRGEHIEGCCLIPLTQISLQALPADNKSIVLYCRSGKRSAAAAEKLLSQAPHLDIYSLDGGIAAWSRDGFATKKSPGSGFSVERQTRLLAGTLILLGIFLANFYNPVFYVLPAIVGLGLIFSSITNWCGSAQLLSKMPWNQP